MASGTSTTPTRFEISVCSLSGVSIWVDQRGNPHATTHMTFQRSSKKSSGSILTGYRIPSSARMDSVEEHGNDSARVRYARRRVDDCRPSRQYQPNGRERVHGSQCVEPES